MADGNLQLVDTLTGEYLDRTFRTLDDIAAETRELFTAIDRDEWRIGANLAEARGQIDGDREFGRWCCENFSGHDPRSLLNYRRRFEVFGARQEEVAHIPRSGQYLLAAPAAEPIREAVIDELADEDKVSVADVDAAIKRHGGNVLALKHTGDEESYTPEKYIEAARRVLGAIDLDPASNDVAQETVRAARYHTVETDGLAHHWSGRVWMNPPYTARVINQFIEKLANHYRDGDVSAAIALTNNNTDTSWFHYGAGIAEACCFTAGRINFIKRDGSTSSPTNGQLFLYFGKDIARFCAEFSQFGLVMVKA
jgi:phage N-6-adenine-methyltransferase